MREVSWLIKLFELEVIAAIGTIVVVFCVVDVRLGRNIRCWKARNWSRRRFRVQAKNIGVN